MPATQFSPVLNLYISDTFFSYMNFQVSLTLSHKFPFIPRPCKLWNALPSSSFPESYNVSVVKSNINKLDFISLVSLSFFGGFAISFSAFPQHFSLEKITRKWSYEYGDGRKFIKIVDQIHHPRETCKVLFHLTAPGGDTLPNGHSVAGVFRVLCKGLPIWFAFFIAHSL